MDVKIEHLGEALLNARLAKGLSQGAAAVELGVSQSQVSSYEKGDSLPGPDKHEAIAEFIGEDLDAVTAAWTVARRQQLIGRREPHSDPTIAELEQSIAHLQTTIEMLLETSTQQARQLDELLNERRAQGDADRRDN